MKQTRSYFLRCIVTALNDSEAVPAACEFLESLPAESKLAIIISQDEADLEPLLQLRHHNFPVVNLALNSEKR